DLGVIAARGDWKFLCTRGTLGLLVPIKTVPSGCREIVSLGFLPKAKSSHECIGVVANPATRRQPSKVVDVSSSQDHILRFERCNQTGYHVPDRLFPFLVPQPSASRNSEVVFKGTRPIRKMAKLHGFNDPIDDHGRTQAGAQPKEQHLATLVTAKSLHCSIIHYFYRTFEFLFKVISPPTGSEVPRIGKWSIIDHDPWIANGYRVICPTLGNLLDASDHLFGAQLWAGWKFPMLLLFCRENLHMSSAYIDNQHVHRLPHVFRPLS